MKSILSYNNMFVSKDLKHLLYRLRDSNRHTQLRVLREIVKLINLMNTRDVLILMEYLNNIDDIDLEVKIISILAFIVTTQRSHYEAIVTYTPLYGKIEGMLRRGLPLKTAHVLQFLCALLLAGGGSVAGGAGSQLAALTRSHVRVSGCLRTMAAMFSEGMMFPDTWKALCQCLAECCYISPVNKDYCSHLIPLCIQKWSQGLNEVIEVLQSLLSNNNKNIELFILSNGIQIFSRETLQYESCLQLLCTVVQNTESVSIITQRTRTKEYVMEILKWNGPYSQKGQWCTIILYYLESRDKSKSNVSQHDLTEAAAEDRRSSEPAPLGPAGGGEGGAGGGEGSGALGWGGGAAGACHAPSAAAPTNTQYARNSIDNDETALLFRNVVKELLYWNSKGQPIGQIKTTVDSPLESKINAGGSHNPSVKISSVRNTKMFVDSNNEQINDKELSFSFLKENQSSEENEVKCTQDEPHITRQHRKVTTKHSTEKSVQTNIEHSSYRTVFNDKESSSINTNTFEPAVASTPKRISTRVVTVNSIETRTNNRDSYEVARADLRRSQQKLRDRQRKKIAKAKKDCTAKVEVANRSMSSRFLSAINESCTTFVKTVKDVLMPWKNVSTVDSKNVAQKARETKDVNFMAYMRRREAAREQLCHTCDDTRLLRRKMEDNEHLRKTVKKLKLGINLFGCDFKKISKTFWPQDTHMSPAVLYNLYRKLVVK